MDDDEFDPQVTAAHQHVRNMFRQNKPMDEIAAYLYNHENPKVRDEAELLLLALRDNKPLEMGENPFKSDH